MCACTSEYRASRQDSQTRKPSARAGYVQINKFWLAQYEDRCDRHWGPGDDPIYDGALADHKDVSLAYLTQVQKACAGLIQGWQR